MFSKKIHDVLFPSSALPDVSLLTPVGNQLEPSSSPAYAPTSVPAPISEIEQDTSISPIQRFPTPQDPAI
jgi:hypothetical protein